MSYYETVYQKRLQRNGQYPNERLIKGREKNFNRFLYSSPHYVQFHYQEEGKSKRLVEGVLEPFRQNQSKVLMHLLCRVEENFNAGDIVQITYRNRSSHYMFYYWDERHDSGYNRWCLIKLNQKISWVNNDNEKYFSRAYVYSQEDNMLQNEIQSRSRFATRYLENSKLDFMILPMNKNIEIGSYLIVKVGEIERAEKVVGFDPLSTPGVYYVSMDPVPKRDLTKMPEPQEKDNIEDFFWGGELNLEEEQEIGNGG